MFTMAENYGATIVGGGHILEKHFDRQKLF
jgi:hypothetical protein